MQQICQVILERDHSELSKMIKMGVQRGTIGNLGHQRVARERRERKEARGGKAEDITTTLPLGT